MENIIKVSILAVIQGIAEFLPISSSGHLVIFEKILNLDKFDNVQMNVVLHAGTLLAILVFYYRKIFELLTKKGMKLIPVLIAASVPIGIIGVSLKATGLDDKLFENLFIPAFGLILTGFLLIFGRKENDAPYEMNEISYGKAVLIGFSQALAILPGVSRSGSTISSAMKTGMNKEDAATFSFLLAIPAIGGASFVEAASHFAKEGLDFSKSHPHHLLLGFFISAVVGYFSLRILLKILQKGKLAYFAYYCFFVAACILAWKFFA